MLCNMCYHSKYTQKTANTKNVRKIRDRYVETSKRELPSTLTFTAKERLCSWKPVIQLLCSFLLCLATLSNLILV